MRNNDHLRHAAAVAQDKSHAARTLLENALLAETFAKLEAAYVAQWQMAMNTEQREDWFFRVQGLKAVQADLAAVISGGQVAAYNTRHLSK